MSELKPYFPEIPKPVQYAPFVDILVVKQLAENHVRDVLKDYPGLVKTILGYEWNDFVVKCRDGCNRMIEAGFIRGPFGLKDFIQQCAARRGAIVLETLGHKKKNAK